MKTVLETRNEIGVYNNLLNNFIKTFDLKIFNQRYLPIYAIRELRDYHEIKNELYDLLISKSEQIREYSNDYYSWKSPIYIAQKMGLSLSDILEYLNKDKGDFFQLSHFYNLNTKNQTSIYTDIRKTVDNVIYENSEIKKVSSYEIFKNIQLVKMWERLNLTTNQTSP